jgi:hypothetical protein
MAKLSTSTVTINDGDILLYKRVKSSVWQAKFKIGSRWVRATTKLDDLEKAKAAAKDLFTEYKFKEKHELPVITKRFADVAHFVIADMRTALNGGGGKKVFEDYITALDRYLIPYFGKKHVGNIGYDDIKGFDIWRKAEMKRDPKASTINTHNSALMLTDQRISALVDFPDAAEAFPGVDIGGGISYFLWDRQHTGGCAVRTIASGIPDEVVVRRLDAYNVFVRYNKGVAILEKVWPNGVNAPSLAEKVSPTQPFGLRTNIRGADNAKGINKPVILRSSAGVSYISRDDIPRNKEWLDQWKVILGLAYAYYQSRWQEDAGAVPRFLWNAKMRFGKTFTSYQLAKKLDAKRVLVRIRHRPVAGRGQSRKRRARACLVPACSRL